MRIKRILSAILISFSFILLLSSCTKSGDKIKVTAEKTEFVNFSSDYNMPSKSLTTYFVEDSDTRYVDVVGFFRNLKGLYLTSYLKTNSTFFSDYLKISCRVKVSETQILNVYVIFDWNTEEIIISNSVFFNLINISSTTNYSRWLSESPTDVESDSIVFKLSDFDMNIYMKNGKVLVPFSIMNLIFCSNDYYNIYYNGSRYFGVTYDISIYNREDLKQLKTCALNGKAQTVEQREFNYNFIRFAMYYYYGLKEYKGIDDIDEELAPYKEGFLSLDPLVNKQTYFDYFVLHLDELHTRIGQNSLYLEPTDLDTNNWNLDVTSQARKNYSQVQTMLQNLSSSYYEDNKDSYRINGDTMIIYLSSFKTGTDEQVNSQDAYLYDTFEYMLYALNKASIFGISNIVVDVSLNGGGNMGALIRVLGTMSNDPIDYCTYDYLFKNGKSIKMNVDVNKDGDFSDDDAYTNFNWYVLSSFNTFSAANSFTALAKSIGAKVIGQKSGGGMCSVFPLVLPDQTSIEISSYNAEMAKLNGKYEFIEGGIEPDIYIDYDHFYDISYIKTVLD